MAGSRFLVRFRLNIALKTSIKVGSSLLILVVICAKTGLNQPLKHSARLRLVFINGMLRSNVSNRTGTLTWWSHLLSQASPLLI